MTNERKTENIVRKHFEKYLSECTIEEQKSDTPKIHKLLKNASKSGEKAGYPEFIIQINDSPNLLIVIECKADVKKHHSKTLDRYADFAVDGVLLYASFLSKEYDVLAIAVSGETKKELKVSNYLHISGQNKATDIFSNELLSIKSYLKKYINSPIKFRQDYNSLLSFSKELNKILHSKKVKESQRSLLISGILIALENEAFKNSYKLHKKPEELTNSLVNTVVNELRSVKITNKKLENLKTAYSFIKTHSSLSGEKGVLVNIIEAIDQNINYFLKTYKYFDVLGQFYIEFLRYANNDKGLGIVLTPHHITELFSDLAEVSKDDIVYDNCAGTGGFLISAMQKMILATKGNIEKENAIKKNQLIGVEYQDDIYALAYSNMFVHQDGRNNIIHGNCFDTNIINKVKRYKPTVGFLNPPYPKLDTDPIELEFVLNNLEILRPNSTCIAIIPISSVLATSGKDYEVKSKILESHTLEAALSMPEQLFHNSKVAVVTIVLVITAHKPHSSEKKTWFGYFRNDGYIVQKHKGRGDFHNKWHEIRNLWIKSFKNRESIDGLSVLKEVNAENEWCAEAYMETDYSKINEDEFLNELRKYAAFSIITNNKQ